MVRGRELLTFVVYDIQEDRTRVRIADVCKDYGLDHIQYSAFCGLLDSTRRTEMFTRLVSTLGDGVGRILVLPVCEKDVEARRLHVREA
jgi:CRISPR-associated protein Cas2